MDDNVMKLKPYEYKRPPGELYMLKKKDWRKLGFAKRHGQIVECYVAADRITFQFLTPLWIKICYAPFLPIVLLMAGLGNWQEFVRETKSVYNEKKYGSFSSDVTWQNRNTSSYDKIVDYLKQTGKWRE